MEILNGFSPQKKRCKNGGFFCLIGDVNNNHKITMFLKYDIQNILALQMQHQSYGNDMTFIII